MCGFVVTRTGTPVNDALLRRRGPDGSGRLTRDGLEFRHYLLHITGEATLQPFHDGDIVCVYNGEIYNHPFQRSDGEVLISLYRKHGVEFARQLDGEFAIAIYDFAQQRAVFATDPFGTKPLFVNGVECASYHSALAGDRVPPNTTLVRPLGGGEHRALESFTFDFANQTKDSYDDWHKAFAEAIRKRAKPGCFMTLSSGYDSGSIACELVRQGASFTSYSVRAGEDLDILQARIARTRGVFLEMTVDDYEEHTRFLQHHCEPASFSRESGMEMHCEHLYQDPGAVGASFVFSKARKRGQNVHLSGQGGDEIYSDYSYIPANSSLHGVYPTELTPWRNFYGGAQRAYLAKEEHVAGAYGIETRYPMLDRQLVQEFLWLTPELKNRHYKAPIHDYLIRSDFPFRPGLKTGFSAMQSLTPRNDPRLRTLLAWNKRMWKQPPGTSGPSGPSEPS
jgi:asparagine synthetase B (glutamine-hydrolysing)